MDVALFGMNLESVHACSPEQISIHGYPIAQRKLCPPLHQSVPIQLCIQRSRVNRVIKLSDVDKHPNQFLSVRIVILNFNTHGSPALQMQFADFRHCIANVG